MPLSALRREVTQRFHEVDSFLSLITSMESTQPSIAPDSVDVRMLRGLFYVHLYGALEFAMDQAFVRLAQSVSSYPVEARHLERVLFSVAMDRSFASLQEMRNFSRMFNKRAEMIEAMSASASIRLPDTVLSGGMRSLTQGVIAVAFRVYGIKDSPLVDPAAGTYMDEVFERRCAVAHGRESPVLVGVRRSNELRFRYNALYRQFSYVFDKLEDVIASRKFIEIQHRARYPA